MRWKLTTLIENHIDEEERYGCEHGLSVFIESVDQDVPIRLLMDTGQSGLFYDNAMKMGISLANLSALLISHAHYDHAGGVKRLLEEVNVKKLYVGKNFFREKYHEKKDGTLKNIGISFSKEELEKKGVSVCEIRKEEQMIFPGVTVYSNFESVVEYEQLNPHFFVKREREDSNDSCMDEITPQSLACEEKSEYMKDYFTDEIAVAFDVEKGLVVIVGCSHPGIMNILRTIEHRSGKRICGVIGGTHLIEADEERLRKTIAELKERDISFIAVSHCTGEENLEIIKENFGEKFIFNCTGNVIEF